MTANDDDSLNQPISSVDSSSSIRQFLTRRNMFPPDRYTKTAT